MSEAFYGHQSTSVHGYVQVETYLFDEFVPAVPSSDAVVAGLSSTQVSRPFTPPPQHRNLLVTAYDRCQRCDASSLRV